MKHFAADARAKTRGKETLRMANGEKDEEERERDSEGERNQETRKFRGRNLACGSSGKSKKSGRRIAVELKTMIS